MEIQKNLAVRDGGILNERDDFLIDGIIAYLRGDVFVWERTSST